MKKRGFYVARKPAKSRSNKFIICESRVFTPTENSEKSLSRAKFEAARWADHVVSEYPKDDVFIVEIRNIEDVRDEC